MYFLIMWREPLWSSALYGGLMETAAEVFSAHSGDVKKIVNIRVCLVYYVLIKCVCG